MSSAVEFDSLPPLIAAQENTVIALTSCVRELRERINPDEDLKHFKNQSFKHRLIVFPHNIQQPLKDYISV